MKIHHPTSHLNPADRRGNAVIASALKTHPLKEGDSEAAVKWMKRMLRVAGFGAGADDAKFGPQATAALKQFQAAEGLTATGALDTKTFAQLKGVEERVRDHKKDEYLGVGQKNAKVLNAEKRLTELGFNVGTPDGVFDGKDRAALSQFRKDEGKAFGKAGVLDGKADMALASEVGAMHHAAYRARVRPSGDHSRLDALTDQQTSRQNADLTEGLGLGDSGRAVTNLQAHLKAAGFDAKRLNGRFDARTQAAVEEFQKKSGLPPTGRVDSQTWAKLKQSFEYAKNDFSPRQSLGEKDGAVARTERALKSDGLRVRTDGLFDAGTEKAVKTFEQRHHLKVDGQVDQKEFAAIVKGDRPHPKGQLGQVYRDNESKAAHAAVSSRYKSLISQTMGEVKAHWKTIEKLAKSADLPPGLVAGIWYRESSFNEHTYLQNGDPLGRPTTHVPKGIYFGKHQFVEAATAALNDFKWLKKDLNLHYGSTDKGAIATFAEYYNGLGYRSHGRASPYAWAGTNQYHGGMYVADGVFSASTYDQRIGVVAIAEGIEKRYHVD